MDKWKWFYFSISFCFLNSSAWAPVMFKASRCYDGQGEVNVQLNCPGDFKIRVQTAFTGISRANACSYKAWDCVIQEGGLQQCNRKSQCVVNVKNSLNKDSVLSCGSDGKTTYFQIEFDCVAGDGSIALVEESTPTSNPNLQIPMPSDDMERLIIQDDATSHFDIRRPVATEDIIDTIVPEESSFAAVAENQITLVAIVCGTSLALLLVIAIVAFVAHHRIKNRSYDHGRLYGPLGSGINTIINPTLSRRERDLPMHMRNSGRRLPHPIRCFEEQPTPTEFRRSVQNPSYDFRQSILREDI